MSATARGGKHKGGGDTCDEGWGDDEQMPEGKCGGGIMILFCITNFHSSSANVGSVRQ